MDRHSSPGPDSFGPSFYRVAWGVCGGSSSRMLSGSWRLFIRDRLNLKGSTGHTWGWFLRSPVLWPWVPSAQSASRAILSRFWARFSQEDYRKKLVKWSTFIKRASCKGGRIQRHLFSRLRWFRHATRKLLALVLRLDFAKAFDTVNWEGLNQIMQIRGFNQLWCS